MATIDWKKEISFGRKRRRTRRGAPSRRASSRRRSGRRRSASAARRRRTKPRLRRSRLSKSRPQRRRRRPGRARFRSVARSRRAEPVAEEPAAEEPVAEEPAPAVELPVAGAEHDSADSGHAEGRSLRQVPGVDEGSVLQPRARGDRAGRRGAESRRNPHRSWKTPAPVVELPVAAAEHDSGPPAEFGPCRRDCP